MTFTFHFFEKKKLNTENAQLYMEAWKGTVQEVRGSEVGSYMHSTIYQPPWKAMVNLPMQY